MKAVLCPICNGRGKIEDNSTSANLLVTCHGCRGKGWVEVQEYYGYYYYPSYPYYPTYPIYPQVTWTVTADPML